MESTLFLSCCFCQEKFEKKKTLVNHVQQNHPVKQILNDVGIIEFWQEEILIGSKSDKCILKNCNTRVLENEKRKKNILVEECLRVRVSQSVPASLFLSLDEDDVTHGIFLCKPHYTEKKKLEDIFLNIGIVIPFTPNFNVSKPIKAGNIASTSKNYNKRFVVNTFACNSAAFMSSFNEELMEIRKERDLFKSKLNKCNQQRKKLKMEKTMLLEFISKNNIVPQN